MHVRADTASLHAACTSAGDEPDPLLLQTDWGIRPSRSDKGMRVAVATAMPATAASLNPYVVQRCRADRALDPDASWQTDGLFPYFWRRSGQVVPVAPSTQDDPDNKNFNAMIQRPKPLNKPLTDDELLGEYTNVAQEFRNLQNNYYMDEDFKYAIPCSKQLLDRPVYECFYKRGPELIWCFCLGHPAEHQGAYVSIKKNKCALDMISGEEIPYNFKVPKNSPDVIWCVQSTRMIHASLKKQLHNLRNRKF